jgi:hypothetical protein
MRTTLNIEVNLIDKASKITGMKEKPSSSSWALDKKPAHAADGLHIKI